jgi:hypothetical protein
MAAEIPPTRPCRNHGRGTSEGVSDIQKKTVAKQTAVKSGQRLTRYELSGLSQ